MTGRAILLVEDNPDDEELALRTLRRASPGTPIEVARDGEEAMDYLRRAVPLFVLMDLKMPKLDGFDLLRWIRRNEATRTLPVVVLTSSDQPQDVTTAYELGANSYVRKAVDFSRFSELVERIGGYWLDVNEDPAGRRKD